MFWNNFKSYLNCWAKKKNIPLGIPAKWCSTIIFITDSFLHISIFLYFPLVLSHSLHFLPKNSRWEWMWKGKHSVFIVSFFQLAAAHFDFWEAQGISNTPRLISPLGKSHMVFNLALSCSDSFIFHQISHIFPSFPSKELFFGKRSVLIGWSSWVVLGAAHFFLKSAGDLQCP